MNDTPHRATINFVTPPRNEGVPFAGTVTIERRGDTMEIITGTGWFRGTPQNMRTMAIVILGLTKDLPPDIVLDTEE